MKNISKLVKALVLSLAAGAVAVAGPSLTHLATGGRGKISPNDAPDASGTNLWLQVSSVSNGAVSLVLHNTVYTQTGEVYEVWSKTSLVEPNWNIETDLWAVPYQNWTPFTVPMADRTTLFIYARDWTGIDENSNGIPDWWEYEHPGGLPPAIVSQPADQTVMLGSNATFTISVSGTPPLSCQWYFNGNNPIVLATNFTLSIANVQTNDAGEYHAVVGDGAMAVASSNATLTVVVPVPPSITLQPTNVIVPLGSNALLTVEASGSTPLSYQWYYEGTNLLAGATNATLSLPQVQLANEGDYSVVVANSVGSITSSNATVTVVINPMLAIGGERIMELTSSRGIYAWGGNQYGELGDYTRLDSASPVPVPNLTNVIQIASGRNHSLAIDRSGALWAWGANESGQLGIGSFADASGPVMVSGLGSATMVAGGYNHSIVLKGDGTVWTWGSNEYGQLGNGGTDGTNIPAQVLGLRTNAIAVATGIWHGLALLSDGTVWVWGDDGADQLGDGLSTPSYSPVQVPGLSNIVAICAGDYHSLAIDSNGAVWALGYDGSGQLGDGSSYPGSGVVLVEGVGHAVKVAAGKSHSLALDNQGRLWGWGDDGPGQLGDGGPGNNGGVDPINPAVLISGIPPMVTIAAGSDASAAIAGDGTVWQWGSSDEDNTGWNWGDQDGFPMVAPSYADFYQGQPPVLRIISGNNQMPHADQEFGVPLVVQVTDTNGLALSGAPLSVIVSQGDMELRTASGGDNYKTLRLTTDGNGEISLIGYEDRYAADTNCLVRVLAASRQQIVEADFTEVLVRLPTVSFAYPPNGTAILVGTNQAFTLCADAQAGAGGSIQEVSYSYFYNTDPDIGVATESPFCLTWTNDEPGLNVWPWYIELQAVAIDDAGVSSDPAYSAVSIAMDSDGRGLPDYWQMMYFGHLETDPNSSVDGNGQTLLYDYQHGFDPTDYYDGSLPNLQITGGNHQYGSYDAYLPQPVTLLVTDQNSQPLTNAPVVFTVTHGTALIAPATNYVLGITSTLRTGPDGQVSVWVYMPAAGPYCPDSAIVATAATGGNTTSVTFHEVIPRRLGYWRFDTPDFLGEEGQVPQSTNGLALIPDWSMNALELTSTNYSYLSYSTMEGNGFENITPGNGSVRFWFKSEWNSGTTNGGAGPGCLGRLMELGGQDASDGWWTLACSPDGTELLFITETNGVIATNLSSTINWTSNDWHQLALTYGPVGSALYIDGQPAMTNGMGVGGLLDTASLNNSFYVGSDYSGTNQAQGQFDELETFNYVLSDYFIANSYTNLPVDLPAILTQPAGQTVFMGTSATFTVAAGGAGPLSYQWFLGFDPLDGETNSTLAISGAQTNDQGGYTVEVSNTYGAVVSDPAQLTVLVPLAISMTSPADQTLIVGSLTNISLAAAVSDLAGIVQQVEFFAGATSLGVVTSGPYQLIWTNAPDGNYALTAVATDNDGFTATSSVVNVFISPITVSLTSPANNTLMANSGTNVALSASVSDPVGTIGQVEFFAGSTSLGAVTNEPYDLVWSNAPSGSYALTAVATDDGGLTATSSVASVIISPLFTSNNLALWLKADVLANLTNDAPVSLWPDSSGGGHDAYQSDAARQPMLVSNVLNGRPVVHFSGAGQYVYLPGILGNATAAEAFVVLKSTQGAGALWSLGSHWWSAPAGVPPPFYPDGDGSVSEDFGSANMYGLGIPPQPLDQFNVYNVTAETNYWAAWLDGVLLLETSNNPVGFGTPPFNFGNNFFSFGGDVAEVVIFNRTLSAEERTTVNSYLNGKYGLVADVPAAPTNLQAVALSPTQINLAWNANMDQGSSRTSIERKTGSDGMYSVIGEVANATSFLDTNLSAGTTYSYRVRVINVAAWSDYSAEAQAATPATGSDLPLGDLLLWLKADAGLPQYATNTPVDYWVDQSGHGNHAVAASRPTWVPGALGSRPVVRFGTENGYFHLPDFASQLTQAEAFVVLRSSDQPGSVGALWSMGTYYYNLFPGGDGSILEAFGTTSQYQTGVPSQPVTQYLVYEVTSQKNFWAAWINGQLLYQSDYNTVAFNTGPLLGRSYVFSFHGDLAEVLFFDRGLTSNERDTTLNYLMSKYQLAQSAVSTTPPQPPGNLTATGMAPYQLRLQWSVGSTNTSTFHVERKTGSGGVYQEIAAMPASVTNFVDTTAAPSSVNYYRIRAHNYFGDAYSTPISPPTVSFTTLPVGTVLQNSTNLIVAQAASANSTISQVRLFAGNGTIGTDTSPPYSVTWIPTMEGNWALFALVTDAQGNSQFSPAFTFTVYLDSNGDGIPDAFQVQNGDNPINPWTPPAGATNDPAPNIYLQIPANATLVQ